MIRDFLIPAIKERFPSASFSFDESPKPIASLLSPCEALGSVEICDEGFEVVVYLNVTHGHFGCYDETLTEEGKEKQITHDVIKFLEALFEDRVVIWRFLGGVAGGWSRLRPNQQTPKPSMVRKQFLWTKEIKRNSDPHCG